MGFWNWLFGGPPRRPQPPGQASKSCVLGLGWPLRVNLIRDRSPSNLFGRIPQRYKGIHQGWDFAARNGTPCYAVADGMCLATWYSTTYGWCVLLACPYMGPVRPPLSPMPPWIRGSLLASGAVVPFDSEPVIYPLYAHLLRRPAVVRGQPVSYGQLVGLTGSSGNAGGTTPHLHFEFRERPGDGAKYYLPGLFGRIDPQVIYGEPPLTSPAHATPTPVCRGGQAGFRKSRPPESPKTSQAETSGPSGAGNPFFGHFWS
jgi:murein DD-endopeptidase MepM/ murein hydrolase activator NlpD